MLLYTLSIPKQTAFADYRMDSPKSAVICGCIFSCFMKVRPMAIAPLRAAGDTQNVPASEGSQAVADIFAEGINKFSGIRAQVIEGAVGNHMLQLCKIGVDMEKTKIRIVVLFDMEVGKKTDTPAGTDAHDDMFPADRLHGNLGQVTGIFADFIAQGRDSGIVDHDKVGTLKNGKVDGGIRIFFGGGVLPADRMIRRKGEENFFCKERLKFQTGQVQRCAGEAEVQLTLVGHAFHISC